ncbi:MAG: acyl carrier protein [Streptosporangiaceae bacterium]
MIPDEVVAEMVTGAWRSELGLDEITEASFFELGGNSAIVARLAYQIESGLNIKFPLEVLFLDGRLAPLIAECQRAVRAGLPAE